VYNPKDESILCVFFVAWHPMVTGTVVVKYKNGGEIWLK